MLTTCIDNNVCCLAIMWTCGIQFEYGRQQLRQREKLISYFWERKNHRWWGLTPDINWCARKAKILKISQEHLFVPQPRQKGDKLSPNTLKLPQALMMLSTDTYSTLTSKPLFGSFPQPTPKKDIWIHLPLMLSSCDFTIWFFTLMAIALSIHPISGYLPVWNAVCFIYSNPNEHSCVHVCRWHFGYNMDNCKQHEMCQLRVLSVLSSAAKNTSWMISLWSEVNWIYNGTMEY